METQTTEAAPIQLRSKGKRKPVIVTRVDGTEVEYKSGADASRAEKLEPSYISAMANYGKIINGIKVRFK